MHAFALNVQTFKNLKDLSIFFLYDVDKSKKKDNKVNLTQSLSDIGQNVGLNISTGKGFTVGVLSVYFSFYESKFLPSF